MARDRTSARGGQRVEGIYSKRSSGGGEGEPRESNQRGGAEGFGTLLARPVGASIVHDAGT